MDTPQSDPNQPSAKALRVAGFIYDLRWLWSTPDNIQKQIAKILDSEYGSDNDESHQPVQLVMNHGEYLELLRILSDIGPTLRGKPVPRVYVLGFDGVARDAFTTEVRK